MKNRKPATARPGKKAVGKAVARKGRKALGGGRGSGAKAAKRPSGGRPTGRVVRKQAVRAALRPVAKVSAQVKPRKAGLKPSSPRTQRLKAMLESKQAEIREQIKRARADSLGVDHASFPEVGDLVSASVEKEKAFEYGEAGVNALREIAGALEKLKGGTYGICERCSKPIGVKRLEAMPSARLCVKCKISEEATSKIAPLSADNLFED